MDKLYHFFASFILAILNSFFALGCGVGKQVARLLADEAEMQEEAR